MASPFSNQSNFSILSNFSKTYPSFLTVKQGSTSHLGLLPSGKKRKPLLLVALNRCALRLAGHQSPRQEVVRDGTAGEGGMTNEK